MKLKLIKTILIFLVSIFSIGVIIPTSVYADDVCSSSAPQEVKEAAGCSGNANQLPISITNILKAIIAVAGLVAVVFVIIGGINYMTSTGDATKTQKAKNTILYALIGLIICALSFAIVNWTIGAVNDANSNPPATSSQKTTLYLT